MDAAKYVCWAKDLKEKFYSCVTNYAKISFKRLYKNLSYLFFTKLFATFF